MQRVALVATLFMSVIIRNSISAQLGMHSHSLLGFSQFVANHFDLPPFVAENQPQFFDLPPKLMMTIQESNPAVRQILFKEEFAPPSKAPLEGFSGIIVNGKFYEPIQQYYKFPQMEKLEQAIQTLKNKIELEKRPQEKAKLQAELKLQEDIFLANIRINVGYFAFKLEELVNAKLEELESQKMAVEEKFEIQLQAASDEKSMKKVLVDRRKATDPIENQIIASETFKDFILKRYDRYLMMGTKLHNRSTREVFRNALARIDMTLANLPFKLPESQMALLNSWMTIPVYDLTVN